MTRRQFLLGCAAVAAIVAATVVVLRRSSEPLNLGAEQSHSRGSMAADSGPSPSPVGQQTLAALRETAKQPARLRTTADRLTRTDVTPVLGSEIRPGRNLVWCASFQLAWDLMRSAPGKPVRLAPPHPLADSLNGEEFALSDIDPEHVIRATGDAPAALREAQKLFLGRFPDRPLPELLAGLLEPPFVGPVVYAYLEVFLPFRIAFERFDDAFAFADGEVASFGLLPSRVHLEERFEELAESQVTIVDYVEALDDGSESLLPREFVIELKVEGAAGRLVVAMIPPRRTLADTVDEVQGRLRRAEAQAPHDDSRVDSLRVPVIDFDILRRYSELEAGRIADDATGRDRAPIVLAAQQVRFRLDETGALLHSEGVAARGAPQRDLIAWKPFLVLVQRSGAERPFFALWVDNTELLVPFERHD